MDQDVRTNLHKAAQKLGAPSQQTQRVRPKSRAKKILFIGVTIAIAGLCSMLIFMFLRSEPKPQEPSSLIPVSISKATLFPIFYPDSKKLPKGYTFDVNSLSASDQVVVYSVTYDQDKKIAFTIQKKPSETELKTFYANQLPLRHEVKMAIGTAAIGSLNNQTLSSLPTNENSWLLITAPSDINQDHLKQVLRSIRKE